MDLKQLEIWVNGKNLKHVKQNIIKKMHNISDVCH